MQSPRIRIDVRMEFAISAARWVVGKALAPVMDGVLEAWAASKGLGPNIDALKMELLYAQGMLDNTQGREIRSPALKELVHKLQQLAYDSDDVLDELDYFRIQDELDGTFEAADVDARGPVQDATLHTRHTAKAVAEQLGLSSQQQQHTHTASPDISDQEEATQAVVCCLWRRSRQKARGSTCSLPQNTQPDAKVAGGGAGRLASGARRTARAIVGNHFSCCSFTRVPEPDVNSGMLEAITPAESVAPAPKLEFYRVKMSDRMKAIVEELKPLCAKVSVILTLELLDSNRGISHDIAANLSAKHLREQGYAPVLPKSAVKVRTITTSEVWEPRFYGRQKETTKIIYDITEGDYSGKDLTVLPVVGLGGIGKTTLAQHIYKQVETYFDVKIWVCVSIHFSVARLLKEIVESIPEVKDEEAQEGSAKEKLIEQRLKSKRFLLVLDDMWDCGNKDEWDRLLAPFKKGKTKGNIVLVTTRSPALAQVVQTTDNTIQLQGLDDAAFWELFVACVFGDEKSSKDHMVLLETGKKIVKKLKGSPLAAKTVGTLLRNHLNQDHWETVLESKEWEMQTGDNDIMPALKLSYDFLPFHLQRCFSYCALFPEDYEFDRNELIHWWIGLDILQSSPQNKSIEEIGIKYLDDLVTHGFIKKDEIYGHPSYLIHDLLHDLGLKVASRECLSIDHSNVKSVEIWPSVRHLSINVDCADDTDGTWDDSFFNALKILIARLKIENLQTFMIFGESIGKLDGRLVGFFHDFIRKAKGLRVLHLSPISYRLDNEQSMLHNLLELPHLRYLSLQNYHTGNHLPVMLSRLYHLRILNLPKWSGRLELLRDSSRLTKLRHIVMASNKYHSGIINVGKLQFLQELRTFEVNKESNGFELKQLENLTELRELGIYQLEKIQTKEEAAEAKLINKIHLLKLTLDWHPVYPTFERDVTGEILEGLQPNRNLQELCISGHGSRSCPTWLGSKLSVKALRSLHLVRIDWEVLPLLSHMGVLHELTLSYMSTLQELVPSSFGSMTEKSFCNLKKLTLIELRGLKKWVLGEHCHLFSQLEVLIIRDCPDLIGLPFMDNICHSPRKDQEEEVYSFVNLKELEISNCPKVVSLPSIPWTQTLCHVKIEKVASSIIDSLWYSKSSSNVELEIDGNDERHSLDEKVLLFNNLTDLQNLRMRSCPALELKHLQMLTSLKDLRITQSVFLPSGSQDEAKWQLPVEHLLISNCCSITLKGLTMLLSHLPKLSELLIWQCEKITKIGVTAEPQQHIANVSSPTVRMEDARATCHQQQIAEVEEIEKVDDGLLLFPAHLSGSLRRLVLECCRELSLVAYPLLPKTGRTGEKGGLQALHSLQELEVEDCPKFLSAYRTSFSTTCFLFPSSLKKLKLCEVKGMGTLEPLLNLTSLTQLILFSCGDDLRSEGLWPLVTQGQLSELWVYGSPKFFVGSDPTEGLQDKRQGQQQLRRSSKLQELKTECIAGFLAAPICTILSSSLTKLTLQGNSDLVRFTKEQEDALQLLTSLQDLQIVSFDELRCLPGGLYTLPKIKRLQICFCPCISSLPDEGVPISLQELDVRGCMNKKLKRQCKDFIFDHPGINLIK